MPRAALPRSGDSGDAIIMFIALAVSFLFVALQIGFALSFSPLMLGLFTRAGVDPPILLLWARTLGPVGILAVLSAFDMTVFALCVLASRRYWVGLLFLPPAIYVASTFALFIGLLGGSAAAALVQ
jgi:hypothetical protein